MLGDCKEQYQNLRRLTLAPKTKENYAEIIFAYINGAAEFFSDLSGLCSSLERHAAHANSREYSDYEFIFHPLFHHFFTNTNKSLNTSNLFHHSQQSLLLSQEDVNANRKYLQDKLHDPMGDAK